MEGENRGWWVIYTDSRFSPCAGLLSCPYSYPQLHATNVKLLVANLDLHVSRFVRTGPRALQGLSMSSSVVMATHTHWRGLTFI